MSKGAARRLLRDAAALVYVSDLSAPELDAGDAHHLSAVLRLRPGEVVVAADGAGSFRACRVTGGGSSGGGSMSGGSSGAGSMHPPAALAGRGGQGRRRGRTPPISLEPDTDVSTAARVRPEVTVGFSLAKGERTEWAVAKLCELGVDRILPLVCERTAVRWDPQAAGRNHERLRRIARESSMQARRLWLPEILDLHPLADAPALLGDGVSLAEPGGGSLSLATPTVLVGPEGGFTDHELGMGWGGVSLGDTILRIETAAVVAGALLVSLRSGLVEEISGAEAHAVTPDR